MRIQCGSCERAVASIMCCADEAALCIECDTRVHEANKLANKHQRVSLAGPMESPRCDICQEKSAFFFCLEDRALLCRDCDVSIHSATVLSSAHQRFLVPGTRVGLESLNNGPATPETSVSEDVSRHPLSSVITISKSNTKSTGSYRSPLTPTLSFNSPSPNPASVPPPVVVRASVVPSKSLGMNLSAIHDNNHSHSVSSSLARRTSITEFLSDAIPNWRVDELLNIPELGEGYSLGDIASSKADVSNFGDCDWTAHLSLFDEQVYAESFHEVPQMPSPPTFSGLYRPSRATGAMKGKAKQDSIVPEYDDAFVVPDLGLLSAPASPPIAKRRRTFLEV